MEIPFVCLAQNATAEWYPNIKNYINGTFFTYCFPFNEPYLFGIFVQINLIFFRSLDGRNEFCAWFSCCGYSRSREVSVPHWTVFLRSLLNRFEDTRSIDFWFYFQNWDSFILNQKLTIFRLPWRTIRILRLLTCWNCPNLLTVRS